MRAIARTILVVAAAVLALPGCGRDDDAAAPADGTADAGFADDTGSGAEDGRDYPPKEPPVSAVARFDVPATGALRWGDVPFPSDLYLGDDGHVAIAALPSTTPAWDRVLDLLARRSGFCTTCAVYFPVDETKGAFAPWTLPPSASPGDHASIDDAVVMGNVDPDSPGFGDLVPVRVDWDGDYRAVVVRPVRGVTLDRDTRYAVAITDQLASADGTPLRAAPLFAEARDDPTGGGLAVHRVRDTVYAPLAALAWLGLPAETVVSMAVLTTGDPTAETAAILNDVAASPNPVARVRRVWRADDGTLDVLLGRPAQPGPGLGLAPEPGTLGTAAVSHDNLDVVVAGTFRAPSFRVETGATLSPPRLDSHGLPVGTVQDEVPFLLTIPRGPDLDGLPVVVFAPGAGGTRADAFALADVAAAAGAAVLSIDPPLAGDRAFDAVDEEHALRGAGVGTSDGLADPDPAGVARTVVAMGGGAMASSASPVLVLGTRLQAVADLATALRLVQRGDIDAVRAVDARLAALRLDRDRVLFMGISEGAAAGAALLAHDVGVEASVLSVMPGSLVETLCESSRGGQLLAPPVLDALGVVARTGPDAADLCAHPLLDLYRWVVEPTDPLAMARYLFSERPAKGAPGDVLWQIAGADDWAGAASVASVLAAAGVPCHGGSAWVPLTPTDATLGNMEGEGWIASAAGWVFPGATHQMALRGMHWTSVGLQTQTPPWSRQLPEGASAMAFPVFDPIDDVYRQVQVFFRSRILGSPAWITGP